MTLVNPGLAAMWMIPAVYILGNVAAMTLVIPTQDQPRCGWFWLRNLLFVLDYPSL
jgi:hypothetical protein